MDEKDKLMVSTIADCMDVIFTNAEKLDSDKDKISFVQNVSIVFLINVFLRFKSEENTYSDLLDDCLANVIKHCLFYKSELNVPVDKLN